MAASDARPPSGRHREREDSVMNKKIVGGILGILGGLLDVLGCLYFVGLGAAYGTDPEMGGIDPGVGLAGGLAALVCIVLGIVVLLGGRWLVGAFLLAAALIALLVVGPWFGAAAVLGGALSILYGHGRLSSGDLQDRLEADRRRLQERYGASR
jgi:hypothetical protein